MGKQHSRGSIFSWLAAASLILACHMTSGWLVVWQSAFDKFQKLLFFGSFLCFVFLSFYLIYYASVDMSLFFSIFNVLGTAIKPVK